MALGFKDGYVTSIFGRRLGLQSLSSSITGSTYPRQGEFILGPDAFRNELTSAETTSAGLRAWGVSYLTTTTTTKTVYVLDPPVPGVRKTLVFGSSNTATNAVYVQMNAGTGGTVTFTSTNGSTMCVLNSTGGNVVAVELMGVTTALWAMCPSLSTGTIGQTTVIA